MKAFLKKFRAQKAINLMIRHFLRWCLLIADSLREATLFFIRKWPVNGTVEFVNGGSRFVLISQEDDVISNKHFYYGWSESQLIEVQVFSGLAQTCKDVLDVGANVGLFSVFSAIQNSNTNFHAFEPNPPNFKRIELNIKQNRLTNVFCYNVALGSENSSIDFFVPSLDKTSDISSTSKGQTALFSDEVHNIAVDCITLDDWISIHKMTPGLIKLDVELHELEVLKGASEVLRHKPMLFMEVHNMAMKNKLSNENFPLDQIHQIEDLLNAQGYTYYAFNDVGLMKIERLTGHLLSFNVICLPFSLSKSVFLKSEIDQFINEVKGRKLK